MALTYTPEGQLGSTCPDFSLRSVEGARVSRADFAGCPLMVWFICNHCPYVKAIEDRLLALALEFHGRVGCVAICSNDPSDFAEDSPSELRARWVAKKYSFPYLIDDTQDVARAFGAVCTPDLYVYDSRLALSYRGRLDDSWRNPRAVQRQELREAVEAILSGGAVAGAQNPSMGCSIKWTKV